MNKFTILVALVCLGLVLANGPGDAEQLGNNKQSTSTKKMDKDSHSSGHERLNDDSHSSAHEGHHNCSSSDEHERHHNGSHSSGSRGDHKNIGLSKLCGNNTLAKLFLTKTQAVITQLASNGSFMDLLQQRAQEVAYFQSATNAALLSSNCTGYFIGLKAARALDKTAHYQREKYAKIGNRLFQDVLRNHVDHSGDDSHEH